MKRFVSSIMFMFMIMFNLTLVMCSSNDDISKKDIKEMKKVVDKVFNELAPRYAERNGGYTRIIKLTERKGDDALTVRLELVD